MLLAWLIFLFSVATGRFESSDLYQTRLRRRRGVSAFTSTLPRSGEVCRTCSGHAFFSTKSHRLLKAASPLSRPEDGSPSPNRKRDEGKRRKGEELNDPADAEVEQDKGEKKETGQIENPLIIFPGGGLWFYWMVGAMRYLSLHFDLSLCRYAGASAGSLVSLLAASGVDFDEAVRRAIRLADEEQLWTRPAGVVGVFGPIIRRWLDSLIPDDPPPEPGQKGGVPWGSRVAIQVTSVDFRRLTDPLRTEVVEGREEDSRGALIDAAMASIHIPFLIDGEPFYSPPEASNDAAFIDGSVFIDRADLCRRLKVPVEASVWLRPYEDPVIEKGPPLSFLLVRSPHELFNLIDRGFQYTQILDARGELKALEAFRRSDACLFPNPEPDLKKRERKELY
uniref:PNPLA domain-containing protein n=1 Tax=Chromera velia CCMP2878 TaxID=1169474 RepID=A0A0G4HPA2_9ALVE|mmetsp:Transcript_55354/g.108354  ORF Transcript_55354/g.108354 Transcript_55354/m.108354 type:complete len:394 (+) Transcript_55354:258-1439(+)|eukprot:Cvel_29898.t1-p1 / transcript=Cvel_29898.t1 / gene=Cvel_29898 / organism=Chromera_velia_CCMP2878 / gene_product=hypothetical protein / transcript_product=hypothetical protein / location=Cvel_scaffold4175:2539-5736(-) / protein_length=393 / sequence_SO=supercontig / SO=protein_coding / is_pseudo=false